MSKAFLMGLNSGAKDDDGPDFNGLVDGSMVEFEMPYGVSVIRPYRFLNFTQLATVDLGNVANIGDYAFQGCVLLSSISFPSSLQVIGVDAFVGCTGLLSVTFVSGVKMIGNRMFYNLNNITTINLNSNLETVGEYAFYNLRQAQNFVLPQNLTSIGQYAFYYLAYNQQAFNVKFDIKCSIGAYAFNYAKIKKITGLLGDLGNYAFSNLGATLTDGINVKIEGSVGQYAFSANNIAMFEINATSNITSLGAYAFQNFGANRPTPASHIIAFDFRNSTFIDIPSYCFGGSSTAATNRPKNFDIHFPSTLKTIQTYAFRYSQNFNIYLNSIPTLANVNAFGDTSNYKIYIDYKQQEITSQTNWVSLASNIVFYSQENEFTLGEVLPKYNRVNGKALRWYSNIALTTQVTTVSNVNSKYYAVEYGNRVVYYLEIDATKTDVIVKNITDNIYYTESTFVNVNSNLQLTQATPQEEDDNLILLKLNGVSTNVNDTWTMNKDYTLTAFSFGGIINFDFKTANPAEMLVASNIGLATQYTSGETRDITLTNGDVITLRIADNTGDCVERENGTKAGLVIEFVKLYKDYKRMNASSTNAGGWNASEMRTLTLPTIYDMLPNEWKAVIANTKVKAMNGGSQAGTILVTSLDKLWLPAEREIFASRNYSNTTEWDALKRFKLYADNDTAAFRIKYQGTTAYHWWLRSANNGGTSNFVIVSSSGYVNYTGASNTYGVAPCFAI